MSSQPVATSQPTADLWFTASKDGRRRYALYALPDSASLPTNLVWQGCIPKRGTSVRLLGSRKRLKWTERDGTVIVRLPKGLPKEPLALDFWIR